MKIGEGKRYYVTQLDRTIERPACPECGKPMNAYGGFWLERLSKKVLIGRVYGCLIGGCDNHNQPTEYKEVLWNFYTGRKQPERGEISCKQ